MILILMIIIIHIGICSLIRLLQCLALCNDLFYNKFNKITFLPYFYWISSHSYNFVDFERNDNNYILRLNNGVLFSTASSNSNCKSYTTL